MNNTKTIIYGVCGLLLAGVVFYLFSLAFTSLESMSAQSTQERLQEISIEEFDKGALHEQWRSLEGVYNNFKKDYLLKSERFDRFRMELQTLAQQNRLGTIRLESKYKSVFADVLQITMKVEFTGAYENIKKYI
ncbi:MAG: hypothetical protein GY765_17970, partial [bacterium]|nr:hypothetical protein [bacterium]